MRPVSIAGSGLLLRPPRPSDTEQVLAACQDPEVTRWTTLPEPYGRADAEDWVRRAAPRGWHEGDHLVWYVVRAEDPDRLLASIALHHVDRAAGTAELGYWAVPVVRGRGVPTEAVRLLARWGFDELGLDRIEWRAAVGNDASRRVAEKAGVRVEGVSRAGLVINGRRFDAWVGGLLPGDLRGAPEQVATTPQEPFAVTERDPATPGSWRELHEVELTAGALHLRPWEDRDVEALATAVRDPAIALWSPFEDAGDPRADAERFVRRAPTGDDPRAAFAVVDATTGELLGGISLIGLDRTERTAEIGYWTMPAARGRGIARRAVATTARWAFGALGVARLELIHAIENEASCRVAQATGFAVEATLRSGYRYGDGRRHDEHLHGRLSSDPEPMGGGKPR